MSSTIIISLCVLLLLAYFFDITSSKTKIPSVILLLLLGVGVKQISLFLGLAIPNLASVLPILGTVGLILIVLEGSLDLEINKSKFPLIKKAALVALIPMLVFSFVLAFTFHYFGNVDFKHALASAIPLGIISSAIAIPSARNLSSTNREFITYESSLSDIFGVLLFNFIVLNEVIGAESVSTFFIEFGIMMVVSFAATLLLAFFIHKIKHHIKFLPIIIMIILIYAVAKVFHLPALIFILLLGLFMGNIIELSHFKLVQRFHPTEFAKEVHKFKELTTEFAFMVRALFFLLFGYLIVISEVINLDSLTWSVGITIGIILLRMISLKLFKLPMNPLLYLSPRGLITILLFLSIPASQAISLANNSLVIQVIILTAIFMMVGLMSHKVEEI
jgi:cell volume regulation protein A